MENTDYEKYSERLEKLILFFHLGKEVPSIITEQILDKTLPITYKTELINNSIKLICDYDIAKAYSEIIKNKTP